MEYSLEHQLEVIRRGNIEIKNSTRQKLILCYNIINYITGGVMELFPDFLLAITAYAECDRQRECSHHTHKTFRKEIGWDCPMIGGTPTTSCMSQD